MASPYTVSEGNGATPPTEMQRPLRTLGGGSFVV